MAKMLADVKYEVAVANRGLCALGPNYPAIPEALIAEMSGRTPLVELPHFKDPIGRLYPLAMQPIKPWLSRVSVWPR